MGEFGFFRNMRRPIEHRIRRRRVVFRMRRSFGQGDLNSIRSEAVSVIADAWGDAVEVVAVIPSAARPPAAPGYVVLFLGVRVSRLPAGAPVACGIRVDGRSDPVLRGGRA